MCNIGQFELLQCEDFLLLSFPRVNDEALGFKLLVEFGH